MRTSGQITTDGGNDALDVTGIPATAANTYIDKVRVYLRDVSANSSFNVTERGIHLIVFKLDTCAQIECTC